MAPPVERHVSAILVAPSSRERGCAVTACFRNTLVELWSDDAAADRCRFKLRPTGHSRTDCALTPPLRTAAVSYSDGFQKPVTSDPDSGDSRRLSPSRCSTSDPFRFFTSNSTRPVARIQRNTFKRSGPSLRRRSRWPDPRESSLISKDVSRASFLPGRVRHA